MSHDKSQSREGELGVWGPRFAAVGEKASLRCHLSRVGGWEEILALQIEPGDRHSKQRKLHALDLDLGCGRKIGVKDMRARFWAWAVGMICHFLSWKQ